MDAVNPYQAPQGDLSTPSSDIGEIRPFSPRGRMGRLRFLAWYLLSSLLISGLSALFGALLGVLLTDSPMVNVGVSLLAAIPGLVWFFLLLIQRLHDLNRSGRWSLLVLVPFVNLLFMLYVTLWPGSREANNFGYPPPPNGFWAWVGGLALPLLFVIGIVAAIALPAYQQYLERVQTMQTQ